MRQFSTADRILTVLQTRTQKQAAKFLNVSERTIRRWKNEGVEPTRPHRETLVEQSGRERSRLRSQARRQGVEVVPDLPVQFRGRRQTRIDMTDPKRQRRVLSDTVIYAVEKGRPSDWLALVKHYRAGAARGIVAARIIHKLSVGHKDHTGRTVTKKKNGSTMWESLHQTRFKTDQGILDWLQETAEIGSVLYLVFTLPKERKKQRKKQG